MSITGFVFAIAFFATMALALVRHPIFGLYAYIAVFYLHPPSRWWGVFLPDFRWSLFAAAVTLIAMFRFKPTMVRPAWYSMTPGEDSHCLHAMAVGTEPVGAGPGGASRGVSPVHQYVILFYLMYTLVETPAEIRRFLLAHIAGCFYLGWIAFSSSVSGRLEGVGGPGIDEANALGMHVGTAAVAAAMIILVERKWLQWAVILAMAFILNTLVLSGSRVRSSRCSVRPSCCCA